MYSFWDGFSKVAAATREVASVAVIKGDKILMGKRRDNGKFTSPGGHLEGRETPLEGAIRELEEESGIVAKPSQLTRLTSKTVHLPDGKTLRVHGYKMTAKKNTATTMKNDPDQEVHRWNWVNFRPFPRNIRENMHVKFKDNVLWKGIGVEDYTEEKSAARDNALIESYVTRLEKERRTVQGEGDAGEEQQKNAAELLLGGRADGQPDSKYPQHQVYMGTEHEKEHTRDRAKAKEIAKDHLEEDPKYYTKLKRLEKAANQKRNFANFYRNRAKTAPTPKKMTAKKETHAEWRERIGW